MRGQQASKHRLASSPRHLSDPSIYILHTKTNDRAEDAEGNLTRVLEDQRGLLRRERRREREAQLERMRGFEAQLEAVMGRFRQAGAEAERVKGEAEAWRVCGVMVVWGVC